ncbi:hypothetical protein [Pedobacter cryotolerans]|uniref:Uncharacterized protein n=1 Tax=Pedobacter cryotolerans TaxID=2571270 RepID=A0A4U1C443_9SPHI|nr:hypothetical protein [Pedobacter cryotolerans]TKB99959.1 hypothetical protein FA045_10990 [Pedobacter cryotolerans]
MRYALIDNSTLTGIQRLLGEIPVKNKSVIDNDIISFENYIQAILFYDNIICIDDYKEKYRKNRIDYFPNIRFISKDIFEYDTFVKTANDVTKNISLEIRGGKISDTDFQAYFERLQMTFQFTWDMSASKFFLTQKMLLGNSILDQDQFTKLHSFIFKENNEQYEVAAGLINKTPKLYDSKGNEIYINLDNGKVSNSDVGDGLSPQFQALVASLNWISQRTAFYVLAADYLYADLFIQPIRQSFLQNIIQRTYPDYNLGVFGNFRNSINTQSEETIKSILVNSQNFGVALDIPLFSAYFAKKTNNSKKIIEAALNERDNKFFFEARTKLRELNLLLDNDDRIKFIREINLLTTDINKNFKSIESKYGLGDKQGIGFSQLKFLFSSIPLVKDISLPKELDVRIKELEFMKHILPRKGFNAVYRNIIEDLFEFDRIGRYKDILVGNVIYDDQATSYGIKTEDPRYVKTSSYWKKPM